MPRWIHAGKYPGEENGNKTTLSPEMANILSNFEGWGPTEVAYKKKV